MLNRDAIWPLVVMSLLTANIYQVTLSFRAPAPVTYQDHRDTQDGTKSGSDHDGPEDRWSALWTDPITAFTAIITLFTGALFFTSYWQGRLSRLTIDLAREEFVASHRPRLVVRFVSEGRRAAPTHDAVVYYVTVANTGDTEARIVAIGADAGIRNKTTKQWIGRSGIAAYSDGRPPPTIRPVLLAGEHRSYDLDPLGGTTASNDEIGDAHEGCVAGEIAYIDKNGVTRRTGFLWVYNITTKLFERREEPLYYYED